MASSINDKTLTQVEQRTKTHAAMRSDLGAVNRRIDSVTPIIVVLDESRRLDLGDLYSDNNPEVFSDQRPTQLDLNYGYNVVPVINPQLGESKIWEQDIAIWRTAITDFKAMTEQTWNTRFAMHKPHPLFVMVQPITEAPYACKGPLPDRTNSDRVMEWGCNPLERLVLVKQNGEQPHAFDDVQVDPDFPIIYRRIRVPVAMEPISNGPGYAPYMVPACKWTREILEHVVPGGFSLASIENLATGILQDASRRIYVATEPNFGWFRPETQLGFLPHRSSWLRIKDQTDTAIPKRSPLRRMFGELRTPGNLETSIYLSMAQVPNERWIAAFAFALRALMNNQRSEPTTTDYVGAP